MLGCRFCFKACTKNVQEEATKCSLKATEVLLDADGQCLPKFDIYPGAVAPDSFKSYTKS